MSATFIREITAPVAIRNGKFWDVYRDAERYTPTALRTLIRSNHANLEMGGREAWQVLREIVERMGLPLDDFDFNFGLVLDADWPTGKRLARQGTPELAAVEMLNETYGGKLPEPVGILASMNDFKTSRVCVLARLLKRSRAGRPLEEIEAIVGLDRDFIGRLERDIAWRDVDFVSRLPVALERAGAKPIAPHASLAEWYWDCQRFQ